jgi:hypothetical protein
MHIKHNVGENDALYKRYGITGSEHIPETEQLCEVVRDLERMLIHATDGIGDPAAEKEAHEYFDKLKSAP